MDGCVSGRDFVCLDAMRTARSMFLDDIVSHARRHHASRPATSKRGIDIPTAVLRSENTFQVAEFYYLVEEFRLGEDGRIGAFIDRHNLDMSDLLGDSERMKLQGLLPQRIADAIFSPEQKSKVVENVGQGRLRLDQSDIGRFLAPIISPETCRKTVVALADSGLLERRNIGHVMVVSPGVIEQYYRRHLRYIVEAVAQAAP